uniref:Ribosomal protein L31 n=1 Tax=Chorda asiatica TaxID=1281577 RepID=A0A8F0FC28_9PHAE|nr:ribosomal protein L31 [Chorda asiatica]QWK44438.1 ribosomal protein L31 [Chorda asiatica]WBP69796.1 ribosomal protein L31 [Chorda asiatica]
MKLTTKSRFFGSILSDGSFRFLISPSCYSQQHFNCKNLDGLNHPIWTGKRPKEQNEISSFVNKFSKGL